MADDLDSRRSGAFRNRAHQLTEAAARELRDDNRRQHLLDLATTCRRSADALAPPSPRELLIEHLKTLTEEPGL